MPEEAQREWRRYVGGSGGYGRDQSGLADGTRGQKKLGVTGGGRLEEAWGVGEIRVGLRVRLQARRNFEGVGGGG